ncbi:ABC transporter permease [Knoellia sinensis KCTC 19936]|uniref:ABC transporter permease n=1 Tax=Knoellia sinensis KCTC 19936 TaxID=1385520 RepID=A0A0A0J675_9MICO|nr:ABC transporter permease subunit [Knoellia sinensis]KGN32289.1 ABC transporter permease [Knoellia sinensis KCTC 19936]
MTATALTHVREEHQARLAPVPLARVVRVELRKMFNTRSGFWLMASMVILGVLATIATVLFAPDEQLTHNTFAKAIGFPMTILLPIIAILSITGEWSQRTGLTTFTLVPHRRRVILAKTISSVIVGIAAMLVALVVGVLGNVAGTAIAGTDLVWDVSVAEFGTIIIGSLLCLLTGTMLGLLFRSTPVALVTYFVITLVLPTIFGILASNAPDFADVRPWVDAELARSFLFEGPPVGEQWAQVATTAGLWLALPALLGLRFVMRSEVK